MKVPSNKRTVDFCSETNEAPAVSFDIFMIKQQIELMVHIFTSNLLRIFEKRFNSSLFIIQVFPPEPYL